MNTVQPIITAVSAKGCPGTRDGDNGAVAQPAVGCLQDNSINQVNSAGGGVVERGCEPLILSETTPHIQSDSTAKVLRDQREAAEGKLGKKSGFCIGTLNIRGRRKEGKKSKYPALSTEVRRKGILVLALQETKLREGDEIDLEAENPRIIVVNNPSSEERAEKGVAFVLNKDLLKNKRYNHEVLIEGRASALTVEWSEDQKIEIINIYAPNEEKEKEAFFKTLRDEIRDREWESPILVGDFNSVEDEIDRLPRTQVNEKVVETIIEIKKELNLVDGWRIVNDQRIGFTFYQSNNRGAATMARIDRIYIPEQMFNHTYGWSIVNSAGQSDHDMATVKVLKKGLPYIGNGLWKMNSDTVEMAEFRKEAAIVLKKAQTEIENITVRTKDTNPQRIWESTKKEIKKLAKQKNKERIEKRGKEVKTSRDKAARDIVEINKKAREAAITREIMMQSIESRLENGEREEKVIQSMRWSAKARYRKQGEKGTKYWFGLNKERNEKTIIIGLQGKNGEINRKTEDMVKIASEYHEELQKKPREEGEDKEVIDEVIGNIKTKLTEEQKDELSQYTSSSDIINTIKAVDNGVAPGVDGIPYEFYKWALEVEKIQEKGPKISEMLSKVYQDIEMYKESRKSFTKGVMCLLYKKKEKTKIENYRPVTLTNADYKIYTKSIATKLGKVAGDLIHPNQAGFIPGRGLYDHVRLTEYMIEYCSQKETNGCIVALDQEKAYDKIAHDYLWEVLKKYDFPSIFIEKIKALYVGAETAVMVNGVIPSPIKIQRGVRQGCPMSCLLYDLAIEPLAEMIRTSEIEGFKIKGLETNIKVTLFADDTLVYLNEKDNFRVLEEIIRKFCKASTAKFNEEKTEFLPIGTKEHRMRIEKDRELQEGGHKIGETVSLIKEGESLRTLGAWVGNQNNQNPQWNKILEDQEKRMDKWSKMHLSFRGKELVLKALIQSKAIFLATVNGMPKWAEKKMEKQMKDFLWDGKKRGKVTWEVATLPREYGGLGMPNIKERNEAINIVWTKKWLAPEITKPNWAYVADEIVRMNSAKEIKLQEESKIDWALQTWNESSAEWSKIPKSLKEMVGTVRKYGVGLELIKAGESLKLNLPLWYHVGMMDKYTENKKAAKCLRVTHKVKTVQDLLNCIPEEEATCDNPITCDRMRGILLDKIPEKLNPVLFTPRKDKLEHTPSRKERWEKRVGREEMLFDPNVKEEGDPREAIRIFTKNTKYKARDGLEVNLRKEPAHRDKGSKKSRKVTIAAWYGKIEDNSMATGYALWTERKNKEPKLKVRRIKNGIDLAEVGIMAAIEACKKGGNVKIITREQELVDGLSTKAGEWEDMNWLDGKYETTWRKMLNIARKKGNTIEVEMENIRYRKVADLKLKIKKELPNKRVSKLKYKSDERFDISGAKLQLMSQKRAYSLIQKERGKKESGLRWREKKVMEKIKKMGINISLEKMRKSLNKEPIGNKISDFIWKMWYGKLCCGDYFKRIPGWEEKAVCECGQTENINHILLECPRNHAQEIWDLAKRIWSKTERKGKKFPEVREELIYSIPVLDNGDKQSTIRLKTILAETIWFIWKVRNERIFRKDQRKESVMRQMEQIIKDKMTLEWVIARKFEKNRDKSKSEFEERWGGWTEITENNELRFSRL